MLAVLHNTWHIQASKSDLLIDPLMMLGELVLRVLVRGIGEGLQHTNDGQWDWPEWTALSGAIFLAGLLVWFLIKRQRRAPN